MRNGLVVGDEHRPGGVKDHTLYGSELAHPYRSVLVPEIPANVKGCDAVGGNLGNPRKVSDEQVSCFIPR